MRRFNHGSALLANKTVNAVHNQTAVLPQLVQEGVDQARVHHNTANTAKGQTPLASLLNSLTPHSSVCTILSLFLLCAIPLLDLPSVSLALPPEGVHSTVEQEPHSTTDCEWLNTVVLQGGNGGSGAAAQLY